MSPPETTRRPGLLEHPDEAFAYFRGEGVTRLICEQKHMGSRVVVIVCRDDAVARRRFGIESEHGGICYTRTGRRFFEDPAFERGLLEQVRQAATRAGLWEALETDWLCLDCELMPWSAKARDLLLQQYAATASAARGSLLPAIAVLQQAQATGVDTVALLERYRDRASAVERYITAYRGYCWAVESLEDLRLAPFHILASEGAVHTERSHLWHMETLAGLTSEASSLLLATPFRLTDLEDAAAVQAAVAWWEELTGRGGEGMVVKPLEFTARGRRGVVQPAIKCRGPEYLRIIYGPEYLEPANLERLRSRAVTHKRSLAIREFGLGVESLRRFVGGEPLFRVHECTFAVLALESEPVDPRL